MLLIFYLIKPTILCGWNYSYLLQNLKYDDFSSSADALLRQKLKFTTIDIEFSYHSRLMPTNSTGSFRKNVKSKTIVKISIFTKVEFSQLF